MSASNEEKRQAAREVIDILHEISTLLVCRTQGLHPIQAADILSNLTIIAIILTKDRIRTSIARSYPYVCP